MHHRVISVLVLVLGCSEPAVFGAWSDRTAGLPPIEVITAKTMGTDSQVRVVLEDKLGRVFVGSQQLLVFDGQAWQSFPKPNRSALIALAFDDAGVLWAGAINELGYFKEESLGTYTYHSLLPYLSKENRDIGLVWGCAPVGKATYFICRDKLLRWNGRAFEIFHFPTEQRLFPLELDGERWFHHSETGLYRLTETGPKLEIPCTKLKGLGFMGLFRDESGLVTVSNDGFIRPDGAATVISQKNLNDYLRSHIVSAFQELPDGNLAIGTLSGGLVLATRSGELIRIWDSSSGLPSNVMYSLSIANNGQLLGLTPTDFFHFPTNGSATVFNAKNGLASDVVNSITSWKSSIYAVTQDGIYKQSTSDGGNPSYFQAIPALKGSFSQMLPYRDGLLISRFAGVDWFDGVRLQPVYEEYVGDTYIFLPSRKSRKQIYVSDSYGLVFLEEDPSGTLSGKLLTKLPDATNSIYEDFTNHLWIGTPTKGAFVYDIETNVLSPVKDSSTGEPLTGSVRAIGNDQRIVLFNNHDIIVADPDIHRLGPLEGMLELAPLGISYTPNGQDILVTYQRTRDDNQLVHGAGVLSFAEHTQAKWRELDIPCLGMIGATRTMTFSEENDRPVLWLGGSDGILRIDYDKVRTLQSALAPVIRSDDILSASKTDHVFAYRDHHVRLTVFTGNYIGGKDWVIQTRLDDGAWSTHPSRRSFEFSNLSEGEYRFEARIVNSANMPGPSATLVFTILPPWYRSGGAYAGYAAGLSLFIFGFIRVRERRIRIRNQELETLVVKRTDELVKANAAKDEFLASVSHEIRNPMNGVIGLAESFRTDALDPDSRHKLHLLRQCANHLSLLLEGLLDFSRVQAGAFELEAKPFDLAGLLDSIAALTAAESEKRGIPVDIAVHPAVPQQLIGDSRRVGQILLNFINNALNFSGQGEISVTVWCRAIRPGSVEMFFAVSDDGPGISPEEQKKLFVRFERGSAAQRQRVPGTGLGLALCRTMVEKMGGRVWLESEVGAGSCFYFSAPFATGEHMPEPFPVTQQTLDGKLKVALVVDDEEYNRLALGDLLELLGFRVLTANDGREALQVAESHDLDVIFLDYSMPGLSGLDVARAVRALPNRSAQVAIFAVTAFNTPDKRALCLAAGMTGFLGKPISMERLRQTLASIDSPAIAPAELLLNAPSPGDPLVRLRALALKKNIPLSDVLETYFSELETELQQLIAALQDEAVDQAGHYAHLLCGRCAFINESVVLLILRNIGTAIMDGQWNEARSLGGKVQAQVADLQVRLASAIPAVPRG